MELWQKAAAKGNAQAEFFPWTDVCERLGRAAESGGGVPAGCRLRRRRAMAGRKANRLLYEDGVGVQQDYKVAASYYRLAADRGLARAQYSLAQLMEKGKGVKRDDAGAFEL